MKSVQMIVCALAVLAAAAVPARAETVVRWVSANGVASWEPTNGDYPSPYQRVVAGFQVWWVVLIYVLAMVALGMHLRHGIWSATQTLGQSNRRRERTVNAFAIAFATLLIAGYLVVPAAVVFGLVD